MLKRHWALFLYVILLMTAFNAMSHGTQDMYQTFLGEQRHYGVTQKATTGIIYAFGAICGGTVVGHLSQKWGRRRSIILCCVLGIMLIPPVGVFARIRASGDRWICHAIHGARRMGNCAGAFE